MSSRIARPLLIPLLLTLTTALTACGEDSSAPTELRAATNTRVIADDHGAHNGLHTGELTVSEKKAIARARSATARFHDFKVAQDAQYIVQFPTGCAESPGMGAQAYHYMNEGLVDGTLDIDHPELLMYEVQKGGGMQLVGLDYVVPRKTGNTSNPPRLPGIDLDFAPLVVQGKSVWALHIWAWRPNTNGVFTPWNPAVSCRYTLPN